MQKKFDVTSPGFIYTLVVLALSIFAASGVQFADDPQTLAVGIVTTLSESGVYAIIGVLISSVIFPVWNFVKQGGKFTVKNIFSSTLVWFAIGNTALALVALTGFLIPAETVGNVIGAIQTKDWGALTLTIFANIVNPLIRYLKDKNAAQLAAG